MPREQSALGSTCYLCYLIGTVSALAAPADFGKEHIAWSMLLFFTASIFDMGLLISTRPADVLKYMFIIGVTGKTSAAWLLIGFLYLNSGVAKVRGFFWGFTLPFHFLLPSHVSWFLQRAYLLDDYTPALFASVLGFTAALAETVLGGLMLRFAKRAPFHSEKRLELPLKETWARALLSGLRLARFHPSKSYIPPIKEPYIAPRELYSTRTYVYNRTERDSTQARARARARTHTPYVGCSRVV